MAYDYDSVMHYGEFFFTKDQGLRTLQPKVAGVSIGQRIGLSEKDTQQGNLLYNCGGTTESLKKAKVKLFCLTDYCYRIDDLINP